MRIKQRIWTNKQGWTPVLEGVRDEQTQLILIFGQRQLLENPNFFEEIRQAYPNAHLFGCSTAGEIYGTQIFEECLVITAVFFEHSHVEGLQIDLNSVASSLEAGKVLASSLPKGGLAHVFVLSDGIKINGSELIRGLAHSLPDGIGITGGLAADGDDYTETLVFWDQLPNKETVAIMGLYGEKLKIGYGSVGGWDPFGPERLITRADGNVLYEMDGRSALELYKKYLGEHARGLPVTGLSFPLSIRCRDDDNSVVRTISSVNEDDKSLIFAGDVPEGAYARLMKANFDRLIDGAITAAENSLQAASAPELAILVSCLGRKQVLKQRTEEEVEGVQEVLGLSTILTGFYSYGEICPFSSQDTPTLHNQTMTITTFRED